TTACAGGWDGAVVANDGTRGGYRWKVRFLKNPGTYNGLTYPPGTGNMNALNVAYTNLIGASAAVNIYTIQQGNAPLGGSFTLTHTAVATPSILYAASAAMIEQALETLPDISHVTTTQDTLSSYAVAGAVATIGQDGTTATITGIPDIRQYFAPGDLIRFGPPITTASLVGSNGDVPITGVVATSRVTTTDLSPIVVSSSQLVTIVFPGHQLRLGGSIYTVARTGVTIQTITVALNTATTAWTAPNIAVTNFYKITMAYQGATVTSACLPIQTANLGAVLSAMVIAMDGTAAASSVTVTQSPIQVNVAATTSSYVYTVYFTGPTVVGDVPQLSTATTGCTALAGATATVATSVHGGRVAH
ncbi:hypothetical protein As57867_020518, partial [Aphanomyces stellatus]